MSSVRARDEKMIPRPDKSQALQKPFPHMASSAHLEGNAALAVVLEDPHHGFRVAQLYPPRVQGLQAVDGELGGGDGGQQGYGDTVCVLVHPRAEGKDFYRGIPTSA